MLANLNIVVEFLNVTVASSLNSSV